ncbi:MAG: hypothetical protein ABIO76_06815 [Ginsengibacter sp.]
MKFQVLIILSLFLFQITPAQQSVHDEFFWQEYHEAYLVGKSPEQNDVRSITVDNESTVWIATKAGIYRKNKNDSTWISPFTNDADNGPSYAVAADTQSSVWLGNWKGVFLFQNNSLKYIPGTTGPISVICLSNEGAYALGPNGIWLYDGVSFIKKDFPVARSVRSATPDKKSGLWIATDVGLYHCNSKETKYFHETNILISAYARGLDSDTKGNLWVGGLGGVSILQNEKRERSITPKEGCPSIFVNSVRRSPEGIMWVGTKVGVVRYMPDGSYSLLFSRRWLLDDQVNDIAFDKEGNAWIATPKGVSAIKKKKMTLAQKQDYFYDVLMKRHIRDPWIAGQCHLSVPGDVNSWQPEDDDNDGEYTSNYLAMESFRFAVTKSEDAREKARKAFGFLKLLQEVTNTNGFFARTIVPVDWGSNVHDANRKYSETEIAEELIKDPRYKIVEVRWRKSKDGKWLWKGDTSSDEMCGHMMGYYFYYELAADEKEKEIIRRHVALIVDYLIANNFNFIDVDGTKTHWGVWSPKNLNHDPEWKPDQSQNAMEMLAFLKLAYYMTGDNKYQQHYMQLINKEHYLENMKNVINQNPAWLIYFDVTLQAYLYPILLHCEKDPGLLSFYKSHINKWIQKRTDDKNPLVNFLYCYATNSKIELPSSIEFLKDTPLDLVNWNIDHTKREDVHIVHKPVLDEIQINELPPASIRQVVRWDNNPWSAVNGNPSIEKEPVFWLLPYWMGRYLKMIK